MINTIKNTISVDYHLEYKEGVWLVKEKNRTILKLRASDHDSTGFSLDNPQKPPLAFFSRGYPIPRPRDIAKVCDAMVAVVQHQTLYLFALEAKSLDKGYADKQLANGRHFWCWLMALFKEHKHFEEMPVIQVGILAWKPRKKQVRKGPTSHKTPSWLTRKKNCRDFDALFEIKNETNILMRAIIQAIGQR